MGLRIPMTRAEKLKIEEGSVILGNCLPGETILLKDDSGFAGKEIERETLNTIIHLRLRETLELLKRKLEEESFINYIGEGIFITGGCSHSQRNRSSGRGNFRNAGPRCARPDHVRPDVCVRKSAILHRDRIDQIRAGRANGSAAGAADFGSRITREEFFNGMTIVEDTIRQANTTYDSTQPKLQSAGTRRGNHSDQSRRCRRRRIECARSHRARRSGRADLVVMNTDVQSLASSVAANKVQLGRTVTRGLGAGGDPEVGYNAASESADEIRAGASGARMIFICAGLGGGTGSGAAPLVAQVAREAGSLVVGFATLAIFFRRKAPHAQAQEALDRLNEIADAVICFENDRMGDMVAPNAGIHQAFAVADNTISQSVRSIVNLIQRPGLIRIGFDDLLAALRSRNGRCLFGFGESESDNRAHDALTQA